MPKTGATRYQKFLKSERAKTKLKSKELPRGTNVTKTNFKVKKIIITEQLKTHSQDVAVTRKKLSLKELLIRLNHFNVNSRTDGLNGLKELVTSHPELLELQLGQLLRSVTPLVLSLEKTVRRETLKVLHLILSNAPFEKIEPFFDLMCTYLRCAMTHININIQEDSLLFLDVLLMCTPERVARNFYKIIPQFIDMISKLRVDSKPGRTLTVNLGSQITSVKWRVKVLHRLQDLLDKFVKLNTSNSKLNDAPVIQYYDENSPKHYPLFNPNRIGNCYISCVSSNNSYSDVGIEDEAENFKKYLDTLIPLLFETWLEVCPNVNNKTEKNIETMISAEAASLLKHILEVMYLLWELVQVINKNHPSSEISKWFASKFRSAYSQHIVGAFPYSTNIRSGRDKNTTTPDAFVDSVVDPKMTQENLKICHLYVSLNNNVKSKTHSLETGLVLNYIERVFARNKEDTNNVAIMSVLKTLFSANSSMWSKHQLMDSLFDKIVTAYFDKELSPDFNQDIFTLLCKISLDNQLSRFHNNSIFQKWIQNLPDILCCEHITTPTINILHKFATQNNKVFNDIIRPSLLGILKNLPSIKITGESDVKASSNRLLSLLYWINGWDNESLNFLEKQLHANAFGNERSKFIVDLLKLKSKGIFQ